MRQCRALPASICTRRASPYRGQDPYAADACVQRLVDGGFPLKTVGDYVGHRSPSSTMVYAKVQIDALREVALGDGEELQ